MSKTDDLRALREARYARESARVAKPVAPAKKPASPAPAPITPTSVPGSADPEGTLVCGHRAISGRTCTREPGHAAKSHRYS